jgi:hypothetical protein
MAAKTAGRMHGFSFGLPLRHLGIIKESARQQEPFAERWTKLFKLMDRKFDQIGLTQLARYCTLRGIDPANALMMASLRICCGG